MAKGTFAPLMPLRAAPFRVALIAPLARGPGRIFLVPFTTLQSWAFVRRWRSVGLRGSVQPCRRATQRSELTHPRFVG